MVVTVSVPDQLARYASTEGVSVEAYVERLLQNEVQQREDSYALRFGTGLMTPREAGQDIRELRKGASLGGVKIKDLIHEGHKY